MDRRGVLKLGIGGLVGLWLARAAGDADAQPAAPAPRSMILVWLAGGPSHVDTFDPKTSGPGASRFQAIKTRAPGVLLSEKLPRLAEQAHHFALVRGMTSKEGNHDRARYLVHTGYAPNPTVEHPSLGGWVAKERDALRDPRRGEGRAADLPAFVSLGGAAAGGGFLGAEYGPFVVSVDGAPQHLVPPADVDAARFDRRREALAKMDARFAAAAADPKLATRRALVDRGVALMRSPLLATLDLSQEPDTVHKAYGDTGVGRGLLAARRLVEAGVPFVEVIQDGWDTHEDVFGRVGKLCDALDPALAALLGDLSDRGKLGSTVVACMGEFGRTPALNGREGRDHHPAAWSALLAGGTLRGGVVHGETDASGDRVAKDPSSVPDLLATLAVELGLDPAASATTRLGRPISITDGGSPIPGLRA